MTQLHIPFSRSVKQFLAEKETAKRIAQSSWHFTPERWNMILNEGPDWEKAYRPIDLEGKIILDVGAGEGETAKFFLEHGAKHVICVECSPKRLAYLKANAAGRSIAVIGFPFAPFMLTLQHDFLKMDIEGYEETLLQDYLDLPAPSVLEIHGLQLKDKFAAKGYRLAEHAGCDWWTCYGYWKC